MQKRSALFGRAGRFSVSRQAMLVSERTQGKALANPSYSRPGRNTFPTSGQTGRGMERVAEKTLCSNGVFLLPEPSHAPRLSIEGIPFQRRALSRCAVCHAAGIIRVFQNRRCPFSSEGRCRYLGAVFPRHRNDTVFVFKGMLSSTPGGIVMTCCQKKRAAPKERPQYQL